jgi:hypothetical protein
MEKQEKKVEKTVYFDIFYQPKNDSAIDDLIFGCVAYMFHSWLFKNRFGRFERTENEIDGNELMYSYVLDAVRVKEAEDFLTELLKKVNMSERIKYDVGLPLPDADYFDSLIITDSGWEFYIHRDKLNK